MRVAVTTVPVIPSIDGLITWSGPNCVQWAYRTPSEKTQWIRNYLRIGGVVANDAAIQLWVRDMDMRCGVRPAGDNLNDPLSSGYTITTADIQAWNAENPDQAIPLDPNRSNGGLDLTNPNIQRTLQTLIGVTGQTIVGVVNSNNRTPYGTGGLGLPGMSTVPRSPLGGFYGGYSGPFGYGYGASTWTPILIVGGLVVLGGIAYMAFSSKGRS